jgi:membrane fusion protein (multidrug efflux system)
MRLKVVVPLLVVVLAGIGVWQFFGGESSVTAPRAAPVRAVTVATAQRQELGDHIEAIGTLYANESVTVTAKTQGIIRSIAFEDGQTVRKGEEIAAIDAGAENAALNVELANLEQQKKELARTEDLAKSQHVSNARLDEQIAAVKKADANVAAARVRSGDRRIVAPFGGIVGTRRISVGALVSPGTVVATLDDISSVKLDFAIPETFLASLKPGLDIGAMASAYRGETFTGKVVSVDSRIDPVTRSVNVRAILENPDLRLRPGMLLVVDLVKDKRQAIVVPESAVQPEGTDQFVFVTGADNIAKKMLVKIGQRRMGWVEIVSGLNEGDIVLREGIQDLRSGMRVKIVNAADGKVPSVEEKTAVH